MLVLGLCAFCACGPSFQTIYENDARFEHCYALDESATTSLAKKAECWNDWKSNHTFGQTRDRVEYAHSRYVALNQSDVPTDEAMMHAAPGEVGEQNQVTAPLPTNAFVAPPSTANEDAGVRAQPSATVIPMATVTTPPVTFDGGAPLRPPGAACSDECSRSWDTCKHSSQTTKCDASYDKCVVGCVHP